MQQSEGRGDKMTDTNLLKAKISESGKTMTFIARKLGISRESLYLKINNSHEFKASEIETLKNELSLTNKERDAIFFNL